MCGIAGVLQLDGAPPPRALAHAMALALAHRGPDGEGHHIDGPCALAHRRLAILDLTDAAAQPMISADGRWALSYNGEIYNFRELRTELEKKGIQFRSSGDTEVLLEAWRAWGVGALDRLNGMFAFAIWDGETRELTLARDRYGVKPLYWSVVGERLLFGSEIKSFLADPTFRVDLDREGLFEYLTFQNFFTDRTLFAGARLLPAGSMLRAGPGRPPVIERYWDFDFQEPDGPVDATEQRVELDRLFRQAVSRQLVSDVEVSTYLSGGMDSGSITAISAEHVPHLRTFTVGFDLHSVSGLELAYDEREKAEHMSYLFQTEHYEMVLKAGDMERAMPRLVWHLEEPRVGQSYPNYYAASLASRFAKVVLSGTGGDELFGGYPWRYYRAVVNDDFAQYVDKYFEFWSRLLPNEQLMALVKPITAEIGGVWSRQVMRDVFAQHADRLTRPEDYINHSLYFEAKTFLHGLLVVEDKLSMAHGLEGRVPFLDNDLVDFAQRVPVRLKLGNLGAVVKLDENEPGHKTERFFQRTRDGKLVLREVMASYMPNDVVTAIKQGFSGPDASWFRGDSIDYVRRRLMGDALIYEFLDRRTAHALIADHLDGRVNRRLLIWSLLSLEEWCHVFLAGERP